MLSQCPNCQTVYRITEQQLTAAKGKVRCGQCQVVFSALEHLRREAREEAPSQEPATGNEEFLETQIYYTADDVIAPLLHESDEYEQPPAARRALGTLLWGALIVALGWGLAVQWQIFHPEKSLPVPGLAASVALLCHEIACPEPPPPASAITLRNREVAKHPNYDNALLVNLTLSNDGSKPVAAPIIGIRFTDSNGRLVAYRYFAPADYLKDAGDTALFLDPGQPLLVVLELMDPGSEAVSYEFSLL